MESKDLGLNKPASPQGITSQFDSSEHSFNYREELETNANLDISPEVAPTSK